MTVLAVNIRMAAYLEDFEAVRQIRNAGREWMDDPREISVDDQAKFIAGDHPTVWVYEIDRQIAGYGLVKRGRDRYVYVSLAVHPDYRGLGLGRVIYRDLRSHWFEDAEVCAVIRNDNTPSIRAALAAGFTITARITATGTITLKAGVLL